MCAFGAFVVTEWKKEAGLRATNLLLMHAYERPNTWYDFFLLTVPKERDDKTSNQRRLKWLLDAVAIHSKSSKSR